MAEDAPESIDETIGPSILERSGEASQDAHGNDAKPSFPTAPKRPKEALKTGSDGREIMGTRLTPAGLTTLPEQSENLEKPSPRRPQERDVYGLGLRFADHPRSASIYDPSGNRRNAKGVRAPLRVCS